MGSVSSKDPVELIALHFPSANRMAANVDDENQCNGFLFTMFLNTHGTDIHCFIPCPTNIL